MKIIIVFLVGIALGVGIAKLTSPHQKKISLKHLTWAKDGIQIISSHSDSAKQLQEAEKYYGKAVVLFLASLYSQQPQDKLATLPNEAVDESVKTTRLIDEDKKLAVRTNKVDITDKTNEKEKTSKSEPSEKDIDRMVNFRKAPLISKLTPEVKKLNGIFFGTFTHDAGKDKGRTDQVDMEFFMEIQKGKLSGLVKIQLTNPEGQIYSNSTGDGKNNTLRLFKGNKDLIYVEPAPGQFIILNVSNEKQMFGEFYDSDGSRLGNIKIWKK